MRLWLAIFGIFGLITLPGGAAEWAGWRGPDGLGVSAEKNLPTYWSKQSNLVWLAAIPGKGVSSPIASGDQVYLTTQSADTSLHVLALNRKNGKLQWNTEAGRGQLHANRLHNMATPTPLTDGSLIWAMFGTGDLACFDRDGKIVWQRNLMKEYGECKSGHGYGSSPMLLEGRLFITLMHQGPSYVLALDAKTGRNLWKQDRNLEPKDEALDSYSSPMIVRSNGRTELVVAGAESINGYDPKTGDQVWIHDGLKVPHRFGRTIAGPAAGEGMMVAVASGFQNQGYTIALKNGARGAVPPSKRVWTSRKFSPDCPTPVIYAGKVFMIRDDGMASCLDFQSGEALWQERLFDANVKVSPVAGDGKIYFMSGQGKCAVLEASKEVKILSTNDLGEATLSTPCLSDSQIFIRAEAHLYCIGK